MSVQLLPEPVAAITPVVFERPVNQRPDTRPVEGSDKTNTGSSEQKQTNTADIQFGKAEPSARPPGTDPSIPPQAVFDASLISADFKPLTKPEDVQTLAPAPSIPAPQSDVGNSGAKDADTATDDSSSGNQATGATSTEADDRQSDAQKIAVYTRSGGGSPLTVPAAANPDWLSAIEKIA